MTNFDERLTAARIVETEAYNGIVDKASHAYNNRTRRTEVMYGEAGTAYVYLCYGIHQLFNVVTNARDIPHAVLIRGAEPVAGFDIMLERTGKTKVDETLTRGPGNVSKALGIVTRHTGMSLLGNELFIAEDGYQYKESQLCEFRKNRGGLRRRRCVASLPVFIKGNPYVSGKPG